MESVCEVDLGDFNSSKLSDVQFPEGDFPSLCSLSQADITDFGFKNEETSNSVIDFELSSRYLKAASAASPCQRNDDDDDDNDALWMKSHLGKLAIFNESDTEKGNSEDVTLTQSYALQSSRRADESHNESPIIMPTWSPAKNETAVNPVDQIFNPFDECVEDCHFVPDSLFNGDGTELLAADEESFAKGNVIQQPGDSSLQVEDWSFQDISRIAVRQSDFGGDIEQQVRVSQYFSAKSEALGDGLDGRLKYSERPNFDKKKNVRTPPSPSAPHRLLATNEGTKNASFSQSNIDCNISTSKDAQDFMKRAQCGEIKLTDMTSKDIDVLVAKLSQLTAVPESIVSKIVFKLVEEESSSCSYENEKKMFQGGSSSIMSPFSNRKEPHRPVSSVQPVQKTNESVLDASLDFKRMSHLSDTILNQMPRLFSSSNSYFINRSSVQLPSILQWDKKGQGSPILISTPVKGKTINEANLRTNQKVPFDCSNNDTTMMPNESDARMYNSANTSNDSTMVADSDQSKTLLELRHSAVTNDLSLSDCQTDWIEHPKIISINDVVCPGVEFTISMDCFNPGNRWIECIVTKTNTTRDKKNVSLEAVFTTPNRIVISPGSHHALPITFNPSTSGEYSHQLTIEQRNLMKNKEATMRLQPMHQSEVVISIASRLPKIKVVPFDNSVVDLGLVKSGMAISQPFTLRNEGKCDTTVSLKLIRMDDDYPLCFTISNTPIRSTQPISMEHRVKQQCIILDTPCCNQKDGIEDLVAWVTFHAPVLSYKDGDELKIIPTIDAKLETSLMHDGRATPFSVCTFMATVGIARLHIPRNMQALSFAGSVMQNVCRLFPVRNSGNLPLNVEISIEAMHGDMFRVVPCKMHLEAGEECDVSIFFSSNLPISVQSHMVITTGEGNPCYEISLLGISSTNKPAQGISERPLLLCSKPMLCWPAVAVGDSLKQEVVVRNSLESEQLSIRICVDDNDFQIQNTFGVWQSSLKGYNLVLNPQVDTPLHVVFSPSSVACKTSAVLIQMNKNEMQTNFKIPLFAIGGCSSVILDDTKTQQVVSSTDCLTWKLSLKNAGTRSAFVVILACEDETFDTANCNHNRTKGWTINHERFVLTSNRTVDVLVTCRTIQRRPCFLSIVSGDEYLRQHHLRIIDTLDDCHSESHLSKLQLKSQFEFENDNSEEHIDFPSMPDWCLHFSNCLSSLHKTITPSSKHIALKELPPPHTKVAATATTINALPLQQNNIWSVVPDRLHLTQNNTMDGDTNPPTRIQIVNFKDKPLNFQFVWPADALVVTPSNAVIPPRSQLIVLVSVKYNFQIPNAERVWQSAIYIQNNNQDQKCIEVHINAAAGDHTDIQVPSYDANNQRDSRMALHNAATTVNQVWSTLFSVSPHYLQINGTIVHGICDGSVTIYNKSDVDVDWLLTPVAPAYIKSDLLKPDIYRTLYNAFRFKKRFGFLKSRDSLMIKVTFQPRDIGFFSQSWHFEFKNKNSMTLHTTTLQLLGEGISADSLLLAKANLQQSASKCETSSYNSTVASIIHPSERFTNASTACEMDVFIKETWLAFPPTEINQTAVMKFKLCNKTEITQKVRLSGLQEPFHVDRKKIAVRPKCFVKMPVYFQPTSGHSGSSEGVLTITLAETGRKLTLDIRGSTIP